ncbi:DNA polymerase IV [Prevotella sp. E13-17]|uniref:DNA polymerase IV n=1 Tax=Prevotella sp. E13-17 TaxID=2913616 RepID=UPI001EDC6E76|nr:DNA polymerase IV [Prevotella sp. E13-17]UKK51813.1 DNA polymerase IV [Prevotella sp. E13-17]
MVTNKIIHVDMDQFFAAVEQRDNPELRGKPIAVGHDAERGVVSTASYEARRFGVHSAQSIQVAKRLCPQLIIVEPHFQKYKEVSAQLHEIFHDYTDLIEPISLDEAFLDVTENKKEIELGVAIAREIKQRIRETTGLTASAGVSYCKFLAKIASDWRKPDGLTVIHPDRALDFIAHLKVEKIWGVGQKTAVKMHRMGIFTGLDLRNMTQSRLTQEFGKMGQVFYNFSRGIDNRPVISEWERKSVSCEHTFESDISKNADITIHLYHTVLELVRRIEKNHFEGRTLTLKVKFANKREQSEVYFDAAEREQTRQDGKFMDFQQITRSITADHILRSKGDILPLAKRLMQGVEYHSHPIRLIGLGVSKPGTSTPQEENHWTELELDFKPWPED